MKSKETFKIVLPIFDSFNADDCLSLAMYGTPLGHTEIFSCDAYEDIEDGSLDLDQRLIAKEYNECCYWFDNKAYRKELLSIANSYIKEIGFLRQIKELGMTSLIGIRPLEISSPRSYNYSNDKGIWEIEYPSEELFWEDLTQSAREYGLEEIADTNKSYEGYIAFTSPTGEGLEADLAKRDEHSMLLVLQVLASDAVYNGEEASADKETFDHSTYGDGFYGFVWAVKSGEVPNHELSYRTFMTIPPYVEALDDDTKRNWLEDEENEIWELDMRLRRELGISVT